MERTQNHQEPSPSNFSGVSEEVLQFPGRINDGNPLPYYARPLSFRLTKRTVDVVFASAALIFFLPLALVIAIALWREEQSPILSKHRRIGADGKPIVCLKFRTVRNADEPLAEHMEARPTSAREWRETRQLKPNPRVNRTGALLRRSSLDELPQLINVLIGDMSIVGPRPIVDGEISRYGDNFACYTSVKPGMTGPWRVSGLHDHSYDRRVELDVSYIRSASLATDITLIIRTIGVFWMGRGAY